MFNYDENRNEVIINGCIDCPFGFETPRIDAHCDLNKGLDWIDGLPDYFPEGCPLRDPNFKLVRNLE